MAACTSKSKKMGIALGAGTYATATTTFTRGLLVNSFEVNPAQTVDPVEEVRGSLNTFRTTKGPIALPAKMSFMLDAGDNTSAGIGDILASILGAEAGSIVSTKKKHRFTLSNDCAPPYLNLWSDKDVTPKQVVGFRAGSLKLVVDSKEGSIPVDVDGICQAESALADQTLVFSDAPLMVPSMVSEITLGGSAVTDIESIEIGISRGQEGINTLGTSRNINRLVSGTNFTYAVTLNSLQFANETERAKFLANTTSSLTFKLLDASGNYLEFNCPEITYQTFDGASINGEDLLRLNIVALVTNDDWYIDLLNAYAKKYTDGTTIV